MDHPTEVWPRPARQDRTARDGRTTGPIAAAANAGTRLDIARAFADGDGVAEPTRPVPVVPMPQRATPPPDVRPVPVRARRAAAPPPSPAVADPDEARLEAADFVNRILNEQAALNARGADRLDAFLQVRRRGPGGMFGWRPLQPPNVHEVARARAKAAEAEERRRYAHQRRLDIHEEVRAYLKGAILIALFVLVIGAGYIGFMILNGDFTWMPARTH